jgi:hypothetical protein
MKAVPFAFLAFTLLGCQSNTASRHVDGPGVLDVGGVNGSRYVDREEASKLAWSYFEEFHGGCGDVRYSSRTRDGWLFHTDVGYSAKPGEDIVVFEDGSRIQQKGSPDVFFHNGSWQYQGRNFYGNDFGG